MSTRADLILREVAEAFAEATNEATVESTDPEATWITAGVYYPLREMSLKINELPVNGPSDCTQLLTLYAAACERLGCTPLLVPSCESCAS